MPTKQYNLTLLTSFISFHIYELAIMVFFSFAPLTYYFLISSFPLLISARERRASNFQGPHCLSKHVSVFRRASTGSSWTYSPPSDLDGFQLLKGTTIYLIIVIIVVSSISLTKHCLPFWPQTSH